MSNVIEYNVGIDIVGFPEGDTGHFCPSSQRMARQKFSLTGQTSNIDRKRTARLNVKFAATGRRIVIEVLPEPLQQVRDDIVVVLLCRRLAYCVLCSVMFIKRFFRLFCGFILSCGHTLTMGAYDAQRRIVPADAGSDHTLGR